MYQLPKNTTRYIGISTNQPTQTESDNPDDYIWSLFRGSDGESPVIMDLAEQNVVINCDYNGYPNPGLLPKTIQGQLSVGNTPVTSQSEYERTNSKTIIRYPGSGSAIFNPMIGNFYPVRMYPVLWSLSGAPAGVTINDMGLITIAATASLGNVTTIQVNAVRDGITYTKPLVITKAKDAKPAIDGISAKVFLLSTSAEIFTFNPEGTLAVPASQSAIVEAKLQNLTGTVTFKFSTNGAADITTVPSGVTVSENKATVTQAAFAAVATNTIKITAALGSFTDSVTLYKSKFGAPGYRGATSTVPTGGTVTTNQGSGLIMNPGDWVSYIGSTSGGWENGACYQWSGTAWAKIDEMKDSSKYVVAIDDMIEGAPNGKFSIVWCRSLFSHWASIDTLDTEIIELRETGMIRSQNWGTNDVNGNPLGFRIQGSNGNAEFNNATIRGTLNAKNITISGEIASGTAYILKSANHYSYTFNAFSYFPIKQLFTMARGSCTVRLEFIDSSSGIYRIKNNDIIVATGNPGAGIFYIPNIQLNNEVNRIVLEITGTMYNTLFELMVSSNPGLLAAL
jgi:hypothetical protein